jgi:hypothetical protein
LSFAELTVERSREWLCQELPVQNTVARTERTLRIEAR